MVKKMAFSSIVDDSRRMNAKMIAMGQSIDIQKMPRPKAGSQIAQKQAMFTPSGSDVEKMLYPKNFKPRAFEAETPTQIAKAAEETNKAMEIVEEVIEEQKVEPAKIIGDDALIIQPKREVEDQSINAGKTMWERCKHYKVQGDRAFCREYLGWCVKDKCKRPKL